MARIGQDDTGSATITYDLTLGMAATTMPSVRRHFVGLAAGTVLALAACPGSEPTTPRTGSPVPERASPQAKPRPIEPSASPEPLEKRSAQSLVEEAIATVIAHQDDDWPRLQAAVLPIMRELQQRSLSPEEQQQLRVLLDARAEELMPIAEKVNRRIATSPELTLYQPAAFDEPACSATNPNISCSFCLLFFQISCQCGTLVGGCFGIWDCNAGIGAHECTSSGDVEPVDTCGGEVCPPGWRCAHWAFKKDECVQECETNSDCPPGQKCKKPIGTSFHRCK